MFPSQVLPKLKLLENEENKQWKISKLIDDINLQKIENLDSRVNEALSSNNDDALFILKTLYNFGLTPQGLEVLERCIINTQMKVNYSFTLSKVSCLKTKLTKHLNI